VHSVTTHFTVVGVIHKLTVDGCQDTSDLRHFGTGAEVSGHFGTGAEMSVRHFGTEVSLV